MADKRWKAVERKVMKRLGGARLAVDGRRGGADGVVPPPEQGPALFSVQVKSRRTPRWLEDWLGMIEAEAVRRNRSIGVLVLHRPRKEIGEALVVVRFREWEQLHGTGR